MRQFFQRQGILAACLVTLAGAAPVAAAEGASNAALAREILADQSLREVQRVGDFHEGWSRDNQPRGSAKFRGSAGVLGRAIEMLQHWAEQNKVPLKP